MAFGIRLANCI